VPQPQRIPQVASHESCVSCFKGDTTTAVFLHGEAEWIIAGIHKLGVPLDQAGAIVRDWAEEEMGCLPGKVPVGRFDFAVRLCRDCAARTGAAVGDVTDERHPTYIQPDDEG
jgi:hypothetical protein